MKLSSILFAFFALSIAKSFSFVQTETRGKPLQIVQFKDDSNGTVVNSTALENILMHKEVRNRKIVVVSMVGEVRGGKSFFLDYCLRFMYANYKSLNFLDNPLNEPQNWMGPYNGPLTGFSWSHGSKGHTNGLVVWSDVFLHTTETGEDLAILLADTQGLFALQVSTIQSSMIFSIGTLMASMEIYNLNRAITEDKLQFLKLVTDFTKQVVKDSKENSKPFQDLTFLIRDWLFPEHEFGLGGGKKLLDQVMKLDNDTNVEVRSFRENILKSFEYVSCALMPMPGREMYTSHEYDGRWSLMDWEFKKQLMDVISWLLKPTNLKIKRIGGHELTAWEFNIYMTAYLTIFGTEKVVISDLIYELTVKSQQQIIMENYAIFFKDQSERYEDFTKPDFKTDLDKLYILVSGFILREYEAARKLGSEEEQKRFYDTLKGNIEANFAGWKKIVLIKYENFIKDKKAQEEMMKRNEKIQEDLFSKIESLLNEHANNATPSPAGNDVINDIRISVDELRNVTSILYGVKLIWGGGKFNGSVSDNSKKLEDLTKAYEAQIKELQKKFEEDKRKLENDKLRQGNDLRKFSFELAITKQQMEACLSEKDDSEIINKVYPEYNPNNSGAELSKITQELISAKANISVMRDEMASNEKSCSRSEGEWREKNVKLTSKVSSCESEIRGLTSDNMECQSKENSCAQELLTCNEAKAPLISTTRAPRVTIRPITVHNCPQTSGTSSHPHPQTCQLYFECINGVSYLRQCRPETLFDVTRGSCVPKSSTYCAVGSKGLKN